MSTESLDKSKRRLLIAATSIIGAAGAAFVAVPFVSSMQPSAKAQAAGAPVEADISQLEPGQMMTIEWRGKPVWIVRRTKENLDALPSINDQLRDPDSIIPQQPAYATNKFRSIKDEYLVLVGICTHLGCSPSHVKSTDQHSLGPDWIGGFFCPCHGSRFDYAGRVFKGVPAPTNLVVPPYKYNSDTVINVGVDHEGGVA